MLIVLMWWPWPGFSGLHDSSFVPTHLQPAAGRGFDVTQRVGPYLLSHRQTCLLHDGVYYMTVFHVPAPC